MNKPILPLFTLWSWRPVNIEGHKPNNDGIITPGSGGGGCDPYDGIDGGTVLKPQI
jgi:hypothetical protein